LKGNARSAWFKAGWAGREVKSETSGKGSKNSGDRLWAIGDRKPEMIEESKD
jgi:hypothetical protein